MRQPGGLGEVADRLVTRLSRALGGATWSRRAFLVRTSVVGSALALDPRGYALTPGHAYDSVCGTESRCEDAYTAFCCTINNGSNLCPEHTFVGGWWKADRSSYCHGAARYYVDCNGTSASHWHCHCSESATCDQRKVACNVFRYGNCHLEIANHSTAVVCRVVTCTPPWQWDPSCTQTSFTDQVTGSQSAPCLPRPGASKVLVKWSDLGGAGGPLGPQVGRLRSLPDGDGTWAAFRDGAVYDVKWLGVFGVVGPVWTAVRDVIGRDGIGYPANDQVVLDRGATWSQAFVTRADGAQREDAEAIGTRALGTYVLSGSVLAKWHALGSSEGVMGVPTSDTTTTLDGLGTHAAFAALDRGAVSYRGAIYDHPLLGAHGIRAERYEHWLALGGESGPLGLPASDQRAAAAPGAALNEFAVVASGGVSSRGAVVSTPALGTWGVYGPIYSRWSTGGRWRSALGYPASDVERTPDGLGSYARFRPLVGGTDTTGGGIVTAPGHGTWPVLGSLFATWLADEEGARVLGVPTAAETDQAVGGIALRSQTFSTGAIYDSAAGRHCVLYGSILSQYLTDGGPTGTLGLPTSSVVVLESGEQVATFQHGTLTYTPGPGPRRGGAR